MATLTPDEKLEQWKPIVLTKLLGEKKYNFTVEGTKDINAIRLVVYAPDRLKDQPKFEEKLSELSMIKSNNLSWKSSKLKTGSSTVTPIEVTIKNKKYYLVFKPDKFDPTKTSSADKYGKLSIKLKPSEINSLTSISLKTAVPDDAKRRADYFNKNEKEKGTELYPIEIVNKWLTPEQMVKRTMYYLNSKSTQTKKDGSGKNRKGLDLPKDVVKEFNALFAKMMGTSTIIKINFNLSPASAEFFEVLSAIKMAVLLRAKDEYIVKKVLFLPDEDVEGTIQPKIYIPKDPNFPLIDYYITLKPITGNHDIDEKGAIKISVKSHISSPTVDTNTVKLDHLFKSEQELIRWYSGIKDQKEKATQKYPKEVAESAITIKLSGGSAPTFPIETLAKFLNDSQISGETIKELNGVVSKFGQKNLQGFVSEKYSEQKIRNALIKTIKIVGPNLKKYKKETLLSNAGIDKEPLSIITELFRRILPTDKIKPEQVGITVQNLAFICERVLAAGSKPPSHLKLNFYKIFYDQVLTKNKIAYAMPTINKKGGDTVTFKYLAVKNWIQEYELVKKQADQYWLQLRGKSATNKVNDAIGISV